jgi:hypothetical protein
VTIGTALAPFGLSAGPDGLPNVFIRNENFGPNVFTQNENFFENVFIDNEHIRLLSPIMTETAWRSRWSTE